MRKRRQKLKLSSKQPVPVERQQAQGKRHVQDGFLVHVPASDVAAKAAIRQCSHKQLRLWVAPLANMEKNCRQKKEVRAVS